MSKIADITDRIRETKGCKLSEFGKVCPFPFFFIRGCLLVALAGSKVLCLVIYSFLCPTCMLSQTFVFFKAPDYVTLC